MADSNLYRSDFMMRNEGEVPEKHSIPLQMLYYGQEIQLAQSPQSFRREGWDQAASYRENLVLSNPDRSLQPILRNDTTYPPGQTIYQNVYPVPQTVQHPYRTPVGPSIVQQADGSSKGMSYQGSMNHSDPRALLEAVRKQDLVEIGQLLDKGVDINSVETGQTALHVAAGLGDVSTMKYLIRRGANTSIRDHHGQTVDFYSSGHSIPMDKLLQSIIIQPKVRKPKTTPTDLEWRHSYTGEPVASGSNPYAMDVHQSVASKQQQHYQVYKEKAPQYPSHHQNNSRLEKTHQRPLQQGQTLEESYNKAHPETPPAKPPSYYHDRFPSPFEHILRPAQNSSLTFAGGLDVSGQQHQPEHSHPASSRQPVNGTSSSRMSQQVAAAPNTGVSRAYSRGEERKEFSSMYKQQSNKYISSTAEQRRQSSFSIDNITKSDQNSQPQTRVSESDIRRRSLYTVQKHNDPVPRLRGVDTTGVASSPYQNEFYKVPGQKSVDPQSRYSTPIKLATSPYYVPYNNEMTYPINSMLYNPHISPPSAVQVPDISSPQNVNTQDPKIAQRSRYESNLHHNRQADPAAKQNANAAFQTPRPSLDFNQQKLSTLAQPVEGTWKPKNFSHKERELSYNREHSKESTSQRTSHSNNQYSSSYAAPNASQPGGENVRQRYIADTKCTEHQSFPTYPTHSEPSIPQPSTSVADANMYQDTDMRRLIRQKSKDTDLRPFLQPNQAAGSEVAFTEAADLSQRKAGSHTARRKSIEEMRGSFQAVKEKTRVEHKKTVDTSSSAIPAKRKSVSSVQRPDHLQKQHSQEDEHHRRKSKVDIEIPTSTGVSNFRRKKVEDIGKVSSVDDEKRLPVPDKPVKQRGRKGRKRKHPPVSDEKISQDIVLPKQPSKNDVPRRVSSENDTPSKREKRQRKSETDDEYLYGWYDDFSTTEPESDDSEDEDFHCPIQSSMPSRRGRKSMVRNRPVRHSSRRSLALFGVSNSYEKLFSDEETTKSHSTASARSPSRDKFKHADVVVQKARRGRKPRKISSGSASSLTILEEKSDYEIKKKSTIKKRFCVLSSDNEDTIPSQKKIEAPVEILKKGRGHWKKAMNPKKDAIKKHSKENPETLKPKYPKQLNTDTNNKFARSDKLSLDHPQCEKKKIIRCKNTSVQSEQTDRQSIDNKADLKKKKKRKKDKLSSGDTDSCKAEAVPTNATVTPKPSTNIDTSLSKAENFAHHVIGSNVLPAASTAQKQVYVGSLFESTHAAPPSNFEVATPLPTTTDESQVENQLFGSEWTETEAEALNAALQQASDGLRENENESDGAKAQKKIPMSLPVSSTNVTATIVSAVEKPIGNPPTYLDATDKPVTVKKKRGRPKLSLNKNLCKDGTVHPKVRKNILKTTKGLSSTSKDQLKDKLKEKAFKTGTLNVLGRPRKGRPPGSLNKNKSKKITQDKKTSKSLEKLNNSSPAISKPNERLTKSPIVSTPKSGKKSSIAKYHVKSRLSLQRNFERDINTASPCASLSSTPVAFKPLGHPGRSRASTPLGSVKDRRTPYPSPLPPNIKKLTCNSAIGETILHKAVRFGYMDNIQHYLEHGFEVNTKDNAGYTALHEACVHGKLQAAKILLEFGADVNINSEDGTRPIHDAVEYDHVEMTRLLLACGADPVLSKFSGRAVKDMIRSTAMRAFVHAYLKELRSVSEETLNEDDANWSFPASSVFDVKEGCGCDVLASPPQEDTNCDDLVFELLEEEPVDSYLVQAEGTHGRANYHVLSDVLEVKGFTRGDFLLNFPVDIKTILAKDLLQEASGNWVRKKAIMVPDESSDNLIELVTADKLIGKATSFRVGRDGDVIEMQPNGARSKTLPKTYPRGAFCERQSYEMAVSSMPIAEGSLPMSIDDENIACCSRSSSQSYDNCDSPVSFNSQPISGAVEKPEVLTHLQDIKSTMAQEIPQPQTYTAYNGMPTGNPLYNGYQTPKGDRMWATLDFNKVNENRYHQSTDRSPYTPTSDLNPVDLQRSDPNRVLTETESAVLSLTGGPMFDPDLSMMQLQNKDTSTLAQLCNNVSQSDPNNDFRLYNSNHVSGINERDRAIL